MSDFIGHSIEISGKHYANHVPDEMYRKASEGGAKSGAATGRHLSQCVANDAAKPNPSNKTATPCDSLRTAATSQKVEAGRIELPSQDDCNDGLYMLSSSFDLDAPGGD